MKKEVYVKAVGHFRRMILQTSIVEFFIIIEDDRQYSLAKIAENIVKIKIARCLRATITIDIV